MYCLHCGSCCNTMSPINHKKCPYVIEINYNRQIFYFCKIYDKRPSECINHKFDSRFCPIGMSKLKIKEQMNPIEWMRQRIENGFFLINKQIRIVG